VHRNNYSNLYPMRCNFTKFTLSGNCSTYFLWYLLPIHLEQFPDKINCVKLHFVGYILEKLSLNFFKFSYRMFLKRWVSVILDNVLHCDCSDFLHKFNNQPYITKCKGKAVPLQAWTRPKCSSRMRLPNCKTIDT
jgi:hypothetical protein